MLPVASFNVEYSYRFGHCRVILLDGKWYMCVSGLPSIVLNGAVGETYPQPLDIESETLLTTESCAVAH